MQVVVVPDQAELAPGQQVDVEVGIANDGPEPVTPVIDITGVDPDLVTLPPDIIALSPGEHLTAVVGIRLPEDAIPGESRWAVRVSDVAGLQRPVAATVHVRVGTRPDVAVELVPAAIKGRRKAKLDTVLRNRSDERQQVTLDGSGEGVHVDFAADEVELAPREEVRVRTTVTRAARSWLREVRHGALIDVAGTGMPVSAVATYTQKPLLPVWSRKLTAVVAVLALWASTVVVVNNTLLGDPPPPDVVAGEEEADTDTGALDTDPGDGVLTGPPLVVQGTIDGPRDPSGTTIVLERISFGDEGTVEQAGVRLAALAPVATPRGQVIDRVETSTDERGRFRIAGGLEPDAFYRVTAARVGYETASVVVTTSLDDPEIDIPIELVPADGSMSGRAVDGANRPLSGVDITVTDGTLEYVTTTDAGGGWSLSGLTTPAAYQIIGVLEGFSTATTVVELDGGQGVSGLTLQLFNGLGTIRGLVSYRGSGIGAVTVAIAGEESRETTTLTDPGLEGRFDVPALPVGDYQLTFSAPGWLTKTTEVRVTAGDNPVLVDDLRPSTAVVQGTVMQMVAPGGGCRFPDPDVPGERENAVARPCGGVGVRMVSDDATYATTSSSGTGFFQITGIAAGSYVVSFERYGYHTEFFEVEVAAGDIVTIPRDVETAADAAGAAQPALRFANATPTGNVDAVVMRLLPSPTDDVGEITGVLRDSREPGEVLDHDDLPEPPVITVVDQPLAEVELLADGAFAVTRLLPGAHTVRIAAVGYDIFEFVARVGRDAPADAGLLNLRPFASLNMRAVNQAEDVVPGMDIFVTSDEPELIERLNARNADPAFDVRDCTVRRDAANRWRLGDDVVGEEEREGLCVTVNAAGEAFMNQSLPTGRYEIIAPVNAEDVTDDSPAQLRASTVPLDHEQLTREIDVVSGSTERPELRLRRYPVITGRLQDEERTSIPEEVFTTDEVDLDTLIRAFPDRVDGIGFGLRGFVGAADRFTPPEGLRPRISFGRASGLPEGVYRIDRLLPDTPGASRQYELEFYDGEGRLARLLLSNEGAVEGLVFGETRIANAVLAPRPLDIRLRPVWERRSGERIAVPELTGRLTGLSEFIFLDGNPVGITETVNLRADEQTGLISTIGRFFRDDINRPMRYVSGPERFLEVILESTPLAPVYREVVSDADAVPEDDDLRRLSVLLRDDGQEPPILDRDVVIDPLTRDIEGQIVVPLDGAAATGILGGVELELWVEQLLPPDDPDDPDEEPRTEMQRAHGPVTPSADDGTFSFDGVRPDLYELRLISSDDALESQAFEVRLDPSADRTFVLDPIVVRPRVNVEVTIDELFDGSWDGTGPVDPLDDESLRRVVEGVTITLRTPVRLVFDPPGGERVVYEPGDVIAEEDTDVDGQVEFEGIPGGTDFDYIVELRKDGYVDRGVDGGSLTFDGRLGALTQDRSFRMERFGSIEGDIRLLVDVVGRTVGTSRAAALAALDGAGVPLWLPNDGRVRDVDAVRSVELGGSQVRICDAASLEPCSAAQDITVVATAPDGSFVVPNTAEVPAGTYRLWVVDTSPTVRHDPLGIEVTVANQRNNTLEGEQRYVLARAATVRGTVTDDVTNGAPLPNVEVKVTEDGSAPLVRFDGSAARAMTASNGTYTIAGLPPVTELTDGPATLVFEELTPATPTAFTPTTRFIHELERELNAGDEDVRADLRMLGQYVALQGEIDVLGFEEGPSVLGKVDAGSFEVAAELIDCGPVDCDELVPPDPGQGLEAEIVVDGGSVTYTFPVLPAAGTYRLTFTADGVQSLVQDVVVSLHADRGGTRLNVEDEGPPPPTGVQNDLDVDLIATPVEVDIAVVSADLPVATPGGALTGAEVTVTASYAGAVGTIDPVSDPTSISDGRVRLTLPPVEWTFTTAGAADEDLLPRPHADRVAIAPLDVPVTVNGSPVTHEIALPAYRALSGTVFGRPQPSSDPPYDPLAEVIITPVQRGGEPFAPPPPLFVFEPEGASPTALTLGTITDVIDDPTDLSSQTTGDGRWGLLVPPSDPVTEETWTFTLAKDGYRGVDLEVDVAAPFTDRVVTDDLAGARLVEAGNGILGPDDEPVTFSELIADGIVLTEAIDVTITVRSFTYDPSTGAKLDPFADLPEPARAGIEVTARSQEGELRTSSVTGVAAQVSFALPAGDWNLTTEGADGFVDRTAPALLGNPDYGPFSIEVAAASTVELPLVPRADIRTRVMGSNASRTIVVEVFAVDGDPCVFDADRPVDDRLDSFSIGGNGQRVVEGLVPQPLVVQYVELDNKDDPTGRVAATCRAPVPGLTPMVDSSNDFVGTLALRADSISGTVSARLAVDADESTFEGATVTLTDDNDIEIGTTTTAEDGSYAFVGLGEDTYTLTFSAPGYVDVVEPDVVLADAAVTQDATLTARARTVELVLRSDVGTLAGFAVVGGSVTPAVTLSLSLPGLGAPVEVEASEFVPDVGDGVALTFVDVPPTTPELTTTGFAGLEEPHNDLAAVELPPIPLADAADDPFDLGVQEVTRYAAVTGTVSFKLFEDEPPPAAPPAELAVAVTTPETGSEVRTDVAAYEVWRPDAGDVTFTVGADGYQTSAPITVSIPGEGDRIATRNVTLTAARVSVTFDVANPLATGTALTLTYVGGGGPDPAPGPIVVPSGGTTGPDHVTLDLAPGTWQVEVVDGDPFQVVDRDGNGSIDDDRRFTIEVGDPARTLTLEIEDNSVLFGRVVEDRGGGVLAPLEGVVVRAERPGQAFTTVTGPMDADGDNFRLRAQMGTWTISVTRDGITRVIDDAFEIVKDGTFDGRNVIDIVLPWREAKLRGVVVDANRTPVEGATVVAVANGQTRSAVTGEDGAYLLEGLDPDLTWAVTFSPPPDADGVPVTRFIAPGGRADIGLELNQELASAYGEIHVQVTGALPGSAIEVELAETTPFPTLNPAGREARTTTANDEGTAFVVFDRLIPGDGTSVAQDRFTVTVTTDGATQTRSGLEVTANRITEVVVALNLDLSRSVALTVSSAGEPVVDRTVQLVAGSTTLMSISEEGSNRYLFSRVDPGSYSVVVDGYLPVTIEVPLGGDELLELAVTLAVDPAATQPDGEQPGDPEPFEPEDGGTTPPASGEPDADEGGGGDDLPPAEETDLAPGAEEEGADDLDAEVNGAGTGDGAGSSEADDEGEQELDPAT